jgi:hypothetical protein
VTVSNDDYPYLWDGAGALTPEERLGFELISGLEGRLVTDDTFRAAERVNARLISQLHEEIDATRVLSKYARRTYLEVLVWVALGVGNLRDVASATDGIWWSLLYPMTSHAGGPWWLELWLRVTGAAAQIGLLAVLAHRAQVPAWLRDRVPATSMTNDDFRAKYPDR